MTEFRVEIDEVRKDEAAVWQRLQGLDGGRQTGIVAMGLDLAARAPMSEDVADLPYGHNRSPGFRQSIEDGVGGGRDGEILAMAGALEPCRLRPDEGPGDDAADVVGIAESARDPADLVEPFQPEDLLVGGDLQDAVHGRVAD